MQVKTRFQRILSFMLCAAVIFAAAPFAFSVNSNADAVAYSQYDSRWGSWVYGEGTIAGTGCGILSTVNAFNYLNEIADVGAAIDEIATWAHDINGYNGTWDPSGGSDRTVIYPRLEAKFGAKYNITVPASNVWADIYSTGLRNHLREYGNVAIAHVAYGHFIVLAEYDQTTNKFLVLDSAPTVSGNTGNGVAWLAPEQLNTSGNRRMNVDWYCLISSTKSVEPTEKDGELYLTEGNSVMGTWGEFSTETALKTLDGKSGISLSNPEHCTGNSANVGSMAILKYSNNILANTEKYNALSAEVWCPEDYSSLSDRADDIFQINLVTESKGQDGYNINIPASSLKKGWNTLTFDKSGISAAVESSDWTAIRRMRFTWFNNSSGSPVEFAVGAVKLFKAPVLAKEEEESLLISSCNDLAGISADGCDISLSKCGEKGSFGDYTINWSNRSSDKNEQILSLDLDESFNARRFNKFTFVIKSSANLNTVGHKTDTVDIILTEKGKETGYRYTVKGYYFNGSFQTLNFDLASFAQKDNSVDLSKIDSIKLVYTNKTGGENVDFSISKLALTDKKAAVYGDADGDGQVTVTDALLVLQKSVKKIEFSQDAEALCDVNGDGEITVTDSLLILQKAVKKIDKFDVE